MLDLVMDAWLVADFIFITLLILDIRNSKRERTKDNTTHSPRS